MLDVMKASMGKEKEEREGDDEFGMSLELSIGGSYAKADDNSKGKTEYKSEENGSNSCFAGPEENGFVISAMDLQRRREMQALRRQEARKKREEKLLKKSRGSGFVVDDNKLLLLSSLEAQQVRARAVEREARERDSEERARKKKDKDVGKCVISDLNLSLFSGEDYNDEMIEGQSERLYPQVQQFVAGCGNGTFGCPCPWKGNVGCSSVGGSTSVDYCDDSEQSNGGGMVNGRGNLNAGSNGSLGQCSSAVSDYQSTWRKGGNTGDGGSNLHLEGNGSSSPTQLDKVAPLSISHSSWTRLPQESKTGSCPDQIANSNSPATKNRASLPSKEMNRGEPVDKPPNQNSNAASSVPHMPCVTTTGNGPNGRTLTGFLYKYSKTEVSIMCVCHGSSFSPAEFVEHAGGVDVSNPLRHITVVPSPMAFR